MKNTIISSKIFSFFDYFLHSSSFSTVLSPLSIPPTPLTHKNISSRNDGVSVNILDPDSSFLSSPPPPSPLTFINSLLSLPSPSSLLPNPDPLPVCSSFFFPLEFGSLLPVSSLWNHTPLTLCPPPPQLFSVPISIPKPIQFPRFPSYFSLI